MTEADPILAILAEHRETLRALGVRRLGLFGSYAKGTTHPASDVDLLFRMDGLTWVKWMQLWDWLEGILGLPIDLVPEDALRPELQGQLGKVWEVAGL
jgi:predicted nucleotidyltransferase